MLHILGTINDLTISSNPILYTKQPCYNLCTIVGVIARREYPLQMKIGFSYTHPIHYVQSFPKKI